jgi:sulfur-oxidizing protein SoxX
LRAAVCALLLGTCMATGAQEVVAYAVQGDGILARVGARYSQAQLRLRVADPRRVNPASFMPAFHAANNPSRIGTQWVDKPILGAQQVEDVVAWLATLR